MWAGLFTAGLMAAAELPPKVQMLVPGFTVRELPVRLPNVSQLRCAPDGRLFALAQDGKIYLLRDSNRDGLEDRAEVFWQPPTNHLAPNVFASALWPAAEGVYLATPGVISLLTDTNRDGRADVENLLARLGPTMEVSGLTRDAGSNLFFTVGPGAADVPNRDRQLVSVQKLAPDGSLATVATSLRGAGALRFNGAGDLFVTDRTGVSGDGLHHIEVGYNLLLDSHRMRRVVEFGPAPQGVDGFIFNEPSPGPGLFGPAWWQGDALVAGTARGKLWRVRLVKTAHGYIGREYPIASVNRSAVDLALSPSGALYLSVTNQGDAAGGRLFQITYTDRAVPQPVLAASFHPRGAIAYFDRELEDSATNSWPGTTLEYGEQVRAGDRSEVIPKSGLASRRELSAVRAKLSADRRAMILLSTPCPDPVTYAFALSGLSAGGSAPARMEMAFDHVGVEASWMVRMGGNSGGESAWVPHLDLSASVEWMRGTCVPDILRRWMETGLTNEYRPRLELSTHLKFPPGAHTLHFESEVKFSVTGEFRPAAGATNPATNQVWTSQSAGGANTLDLSWTAEAGHEQELKLAFARLTNAVLPKLEVSYTSAGDTTHRAIPATWLVNPPGRPHRH